MNARWFDVVAQGRAIALADLGVRPRDGLDGEHREFLLGLRPVLPMADGPLARRVMALARSLDFRLAAQVFWLPTPDGPVGVNLAAVRAVRGRTTRDELHEMARTGAYGPLLLPVRPVGADADTPRKRLAERPPTLVLSSAGDPAGVADALHAHLSGLRLHGHGDATLVLADDAKPADAAVLHALAAEMTREYGIEVTRFSEWAGDGRTGTKQQFRDRLIGRLGDRADEDTLRRILAPGLPGTANAVFAAFRGQDFIWLEQDARPLALESPGGDPYDWSARPPATYVGSDSAIVRHPVDIAHIVDRLLYAPDLEAAPMDRQRASYEDTDFELFAGSAAPGEVGMVHFHTAGHPDFRAEFNHRLVLDESTTPDDRGVLRAGGLTIRRAYAGVPPTLALRRWTSAFGTVVGFSGRTTRAQPLTMWDTPVRLVDFAVGQLAQARGLAGAVAGTSLEHSRGEVTDSGRGELTSYLGTEELLWPLLAAARAAFDRVDPGGDYPDWLARAADSLVAVSGTPVVPAGLAYARWAELRHDVDAARASARAEIRAYGDDLAGRLTPHWSDLYLSLNRTAASSLVRYAAQLRAWACLTSD